jgi:NTP pyrophosphatase (non-canonical NTP hydrolase)
MANFGESEFGPIAEYQFAEYFYQMQADAAATNYKNGFNEDDFLVDEFEAVLDGARPDISDKYRKIFKSFRNARTGLKIALSMGELGETLEAVRKNLGPDSHCPEFTSEEVELADVILRIMNYATDRKLHLAEAIVAKNRFNRNREDHSKENRAAEHGKQF